MSVESQSSSKKPEPTRLLNIQQVCERVPFHRVYIHRLVARRAFPRPVKMGKRRNGWVEAEVEAWIAERIAERDAAPEHDANDELEPIPPHKSLSSSP